jgi:hypothetical protein
MEPSKSSAFSSLSCNHVQLFLHKVTGHSRFWQKIALTHPNWVWCNAVTEYNRKLGKLDSVRVRTGEGWAYTYNTYEVIICAHLLLAGPQLDILSGWLRHLPWGSRRHVLLKIQKAFTHLHDVTLSSQWTRENFKPHKELLHQLNNSWIFKNVLNCGIKNSSYSYNKTNEMR